jgi:hypothetical protein
MQLEREGSPLPNLRLPQAKLSRKFNQIVRGRIRWFDPICPARQSVSPNGVKVASGRSPDRSRVHPVPQSSQGSNSFPPAAIAALSNCMRCAARLKIEGARVAVGRQGMDATLFIGAPLGFGILLAVGILMVAMSYLSQ